MTFFSLLLLSPGSVKTLVFLFLRYLLNSFKRIRIQHLPSHQNLCPPKQFMLKLLAKYGSYIDKSTMCYSQRCYDKGQYQILKKNCSVCWLHRKRLHKLLLYFHRGMLCKKHQKHLLNPHLLYSHLGHVTTKQNIYNFLNICCNTNTNVGPFHRKLVFGEFIPLIRCSIMHIYKSIFSDI